jgi:hypothetical protein
VSKQGTRRKGRSAQAVCFTCRQDLDDDGFRTLAGACESCFPSLGSLPEEKLAAYLEHVTVPAAILSPDLTVTLANSLFREALGHDAIGRRSGEALSCMYTAMLGRCGETVACMLCSLKRSVERTIASGEGLRDVAVSYPHKEEMRKTLTITTEKLGSSVLVLMVHR